MKTADYALTRQDTVLDHAVFSDDTSTASTVRLFTTATAIASWIGDYDDAAADKDRPGREFTVVDAMAASGDYFITLATHLDKIAQSMPRDSTEQIEIENLVTTLFYLQDHYAIIAKHKLQ